jgi:hypothetical protein
MAKYFNYFPKTYYTSQSTTTENVTNIIARYAFEQAFKENTSVFYDYDIQDSDTPEIIASKIYGSPERHWLVLMMNDIVDAQYDWPLKQDTLIKYINSKYQSSANTQTGQTGLQWAQSNNHSYYRIETRTTGYNNASIEKKYEIDANTYNSLAPTLTSVILDNGISITISISKDVKSYYVYEDEENEKKRTIKLLKPELAFTVERELKDIFSR